MLCRCPSVRSDTCSTSSKDNVVDVSRTLESREVQRDRRRELLCEVMCEEKADAFTRL